MNHKTQVEDVLIIGSGLAAYGGCIALLNRGNIDISVIDIGLEEPYPNQPNAAIPNSVRLNKGYFPYGVNDKRWVVDIYSKRICSSHAIGGYSKVYSGSILAPQDADLVSWPESSKPSNSDYEAIVESLKIWHTEDELSQAFPTNMKFRNKPARKNVYAGLPRIALDRQSREDIPFDCASNFKFWANSNQIKYLPNRYVTHVESQNGVVLVHIQTQKGMDVKRFKTVLIAAGCVNTTAIVDRSIFGYGERQYTIHSVVLLLQLYLRIWRGNLWHCKHDFQPLQNPDLCRAFLEHRSAASDWTWSHTQISSFNRTIKEAIHSKFPLVARFLIALASKLIYFSITGFHSKLGQSIQLTSRMVHDQSGIPRQEIVIQEREASCNPKLIASLNNAIIQKFSLLGIIPIPLGALIGDIMRGNRLGGWHYGGTLPMVNQPTEPSQCRPTGEVAGLKNVFVLDAAGFPSIPASTVALLTMANAYRIAKNSINNTPK